MHALKQLQLQRIRTEIELHQKIHDLQVDFDEKLSVFDKKRNAIISGAYEPTAAECKYEFADPMFPEPNQPKEKGIPQFWSILFHNLDLLSDMIQDEDEELMNHLVDVRYKLLKDPRVSAHTCFITCSQLTLPLITFFRVL